MLICHLNFRSSHGYRSTYGSPFFFPWIKLITPGAQFVPQKEKNRAHGPRPPERHILEEDKYLFKPIPLMCPRAPKKVGKNADLAIVEEFQFFAKRMPRFGKWYSWLVVTGTMEFYDFPFTWDWWIIVVYWTLMDFNGFFHILGMSSSQPTNSMIFQRCRSTTNQWFELQW